QPRPLGGRRPVSRTRRLAFAAAVLVALWLLLNQTLSPGALLLGCLLAALGLWVTSALDLPPGRLRRPRAALRLAAMVTGDIVRSNFAVASIILRPHQRQRTSGFLLIPLELRAPYGLAAL